MKLIKDILYGHIQVSELALKFIDTPEFQRLRRIKQLSTSYLVFPSVCHTRLEHSIGVYHLTGQFLIHLNRKIDEKMLELIKLGGLLHDIGHLAFSHTFDNLIIPKLNNKDKLKDHEYRSVILIKHMNKKYNIGLSDKDLEIIDSVINGKYISGYPKYFFQIVCNTEHGLDTDKLDYLTRDSFYINRHTSFDTSYIIALSRLIKDEVCFHEKSLVTFFKIFHTRFTLHKELYQHDAGLITEIMTKDIFLKHKDELDLENLHEDFKWLKITDDVLFNLDDELLQKIYRREFYKIKYEEPINKDFEKHIRKLTFSSVEGFYKKIKFYNSKDLENYFTYKKKPKVFEINLVETEVLYLEK